MDTRTRLIPLPFHQHCRKCNNEQTLLLHEQYSQNDSVRDMNNSQITHGFVNSTFC
nr:MAG TPA: hypothetical protein [Caudoviricetes sp.]